MKVTTGIFAAVLMTLCLVQAEEKVDINGSFEKCRANQKGFVTPEGWVKDKQSKGIKFSATTEEVRTGKFSLYVEAEGKSTSYIYYYPAFLKVKAGDTVTFTVYAKGEGKFHLGGFTYSDEAKSRFVRTLSAKEQKITDGENWKKFTFTFPVAKQKRNGKEYTTLRLRPVFIVRGAGEFVLDDLTYTIKSKGKK